MAERQRVAILGGGAAALSAAHQLSCTEDRRKAFKVTVYQQGWRLGGKGASGRTGVRPDGSADPSQPQAIEEHGLHVWFGFYRNAFALMEGCFAELGTASPFADRAAAFTALDELVLTDCDEGERKWWPLRIGLPRDVRIDDEGDAFRDLPLRFVELLWALLGPAPGAGEEPDPAVADARARLAEAQQAALNQASMAPSPAAYEAVATPIGKADAALLGSAQRRLRAIAAGFDLTRAVLTIIGAKVVSEWNDGSRRPFDGLNKDEFGAALRSARARPQTLASPFVRALYDLAFAYRKGDPERPDVAAGVALENLISILFRHDGAMMRKLNGGMGDVVFAPLYLLLRKRGVRFQFFSAVTRIDTAPAAGGLRVEQVEIQPQAGLSRLGYEPLAGLKQPSWPAMPLADQLDDDSREGLERLCAGSGEDLERGDHPIWELERRPLALRDCPRRILSPDAEEVGDRFDHVVIATGGATLGELAPGLLDDEAAAAALGAVNPVATQAFQLWVRPPRRVRSWPSRAAAPILGAYAKPFDTCLDMSHVLADEAWPAGDEMPAQLAYFCGVLDQALADGPHPDRAARDNAREFLARHAKLNPAPFWDGLDRAEFAHEFWRANAAGWERYSTSHAGTIERRLRPDGSRPGGSPRFTNFALAGDWLETGVNAGCVEAAVISGIEAAAAVIEASNLPAGPEGDLPAPHLPPWRRQ